MTTRPALSTDVVARGLDITTLSHVINFDLPAQSLVYLHRHVHERRAARPTGGAHERAPRAGPGVSGAGEQAAPPSRPR